MCERSDNVLSAEKCNVLAEETYYSRLKCLVMKMRECLGRLAAYEEFIDFGVFRFIFLVKRGLQLRLAMLVGEPFQILVSHVQASRQIAQALHRRIDAIAFNL